MPTRIKETVQVCRLLRSNTVHARKMGRRTLIEVSGVQTYLTQLPAAELRPYSFRIRGAAAETMGVPATTRGTLLRLAATREYANRESDASAPTDQSTHLRRKFWPIAERQLSNLQRRRADVRLSKLPRAVVTHGSPAQSGRTAPGRSREGRRSHVTEANAPSHEPTAANATYIQFSV